MGRRGARRRTIVSGACAAVLLAACTPHEPRLRTMPVVTHGAGAPASLHVDAEGRPWIGWSGGMLVPAAGAQPDVRLAIRGGGAPEVVAASGGTLYVRSGDVLSRVDATSQAVSAERAGFGGTSVVLDPRGRFLGQGAASGAVLGFDPDSLAPLWGWAARGAPTTALAITIEGDVVWHALDVEGSRALLLERDLQTGRILDEHRMAGRVVSMGSTPSGDLLAVVERGDRVVALRLRPRGARLMPVWRLVLRLEGDGVATVRHAYGPDRLAVFRAGTESGLRVVDAEAGEVIGRVEDTPLDAAFAPDGGLYLLTPREVRRVILPR